MNRIDPNHPLTRAARETNTYADEHGLQETVNWLGMDLEADQLAYLAEQRALRAVAADRFGESLGDGPPERDAAVAASIVEDPEWEKLRVLVISAYMDGFAIGWKGHELATREES